MKELFSKINLLRAALIAVSLTVILLILPKADHQSFTYELNQPWKYPLLTAPFDMPILRDSASLTSLRDSVNHHFVPFAKRKPQVVEKSLERIGTVGAAFEGGASLKGLLTEVYERGLVDQNIYELLNEQKQKRLRIAQDTSALAETNVVTVDASTMMSQAAAYKYIDSLYRVEKGSSLDPALSKALNSCLIPNVVLDTAADTKYREQEYLNITGAQGIIKSGQRIVDRGEIVTPQIFTNLNTYQELLARQKGDDGPSTYFEVGQGIYILVLFIILYCYLSLYRRTFFSSLRKMTFLMTFITLFAIFAVLMFEHFSHGLYLVPFAAVPVITLIFFDSRTAIFALLTTIFISALVATFPFSFIFMELVVGLLATFSIRQLSRRSQLLRTAIIAFFGYCVCYFAFCLIFDGDLSNFSWRVIGSFAINSVLLSFAYILIVVIERTFGFTSTVTLVELSDINNKLLRRLAEEAPGTFQHSMQVSTLASEAARAIHANTQLVRTGALYHDIGKMKSPIFFTENQHGVNPHAGLDPETSARKIISHVTDGLAMARAEKLPQVIRDFISEHHGRGVAKYFYNTAVNNAGDNYVDPEPFTYPGPDPRSKETAILMMADCVEAASRSLKDYSQESIDSLVDNIIDTLVRDGRFRESPISLKDIETIKNTFKKRLATIYHSRVAYPSIHKKEGTPATQGPQQGEKPGEE
ncbi:MAG: HDIG domain-containing protein [Bacteroidales bacterium]|nr:HDIG domain-containing protein [Bacteroidales bacterium]